MDSPFDSEALEAKRELLLGSERCARVDAALAEDVALSGPDVEGLIAGFVSRGSERIARLKQAYIDKGVDAEWIDRAEIEVDDVLADAFEDAGALIELIGNPKEFPYFLWVRGLEYRESLDESVWEFFDELLTQFAEDMAALTPWTLEVGAASLRTLMDYQLQMLNETNHLLDVVAERIENRGPLKRERIGAVPEVIAYFVERAEFGELVESVVAGSAKRTVLVGMCGAGKTHLAAALAHKDGSDWPFVVWVDAHERNHVISELGRLGMYMGSPPEWKMTPERRVEICLNSLALASARDRLFVFDGVDRAEDLDGLVPEGLGLRVIATTRQQSGWAEKGWDVIHVGPFTREQSVDYLLARTKQEDRENANSLAEQLGDLPAALEQAATDIRKVHFSIEQYSESLQRKSVKEVIRYYRGHFYSQHIADALPEAVSEVLEGLDSDAVSAARGQLERLAALPVLGVGREQLLDFGRVIAAAERALNRLIDYSVCQQNSDGIVTINPLLARLIRDGFVG